LETIKVPRGSNGLLQVLSLLDCPTLKILTLSLGETFTLQAVNKFLASKLAVETITLSSCERDYSYSPKVQINVPLWDEMGGLINLDSISFPNLESLRLTSDAVLAAAFFTGVKSINLKHLSIAAEQERSYSNVE